MMLSSLVVQSEQSHVASERPIRSEGQMENLVFFLLLLPIIVFSAHYDLKSGRCIANPPTDHGSINGGPI